MAEQDPLPLNYSEPGRTPPSGRRLLLIGFSSGFLLSLIVFLSAFGLGGSVGPILLILLPAKLITALVFVCIPRLRLVGAGIFLSSLLVLLILLGTCAVALSK